MSAIDDLRKMAIAQKTAFLPVEPASPALAPLHAALVTYDQFVSGLVIQAIQGMVTSASAEEMQSAREQAARATDAYPQPDDRNFKTYQKYKERLDRMLQLVQEIAQGRAK
jgi:hypothetical protein